MTVMKCNTIAPRPNRPMKHTAAIFFMNAKQCLMVSQTSLDSLINDITSMSHVQVEAVSKKVNFFFM